MVHIKAISLYKQQNKNMFCNTPKVIKYWVWLFNKNTLCLFYLEKKNFIIILQFCTIFVIVYGLNKRGFTHKLV